MRSFVLILSLFISTLATAQDLVEFENGQVADADDMNANFSSLKEAIDAINIEAGATLLTGQGLPDTSNGAVGDVYIDVNSYYFYGPKQESGWGIAAALIGPQGEQGDTGATGAIGPQGDTGAMGAIGPQGATGPKGDTGDTGATGANGPQGETGPQGPVGDSYVRIFDTENTSIGDSALSETATGDYNVAMGYRAMSLADSVNSNVAVGAYSLERLVEGGFSITAIGAGSMQYANGVSNVKSTAVGAFANKNGGQPGVAAVGYKAGGCWYCTSIGAYAFANSPSDLRLSQYNVAVGAGALASATPGGTFESDPGFPSRITGLNTAVGYYAAINVEGSFNAALGYEASRFFSGNRNSAFGYKALSATEAEAGLYTGGGNGSSNTAIGSNAMSEFNFGDRNTAVGGDSLQDFSTGSNNTAIGYEADIS